MKWDVEDIPPNDIFRVSDLGQGQAHSTSGHDWYTSNLTSFELKHDHPFVKSVLDSMPAIHPMVMFRHCALDCHIPYSKEYRKVEQGITGSETGVEGDCCIQ